MRLASLIVFASTVAACSGTTGGDAGDVVSTVDTGMDIVSPDSSSDALAADMGVDTVTVDSGVDTGTDSAEDAPTDVPSDGANPLCTSTGGTVGTVLCCAGAGDFPNTCSIGGCTCAPSSSHDVLTCNCPSGQCFDPAVGCTTR